MHCGEVIDAVGRNGTDQGFDLPFVRQIGRRIGEARMIFPLPEIEVIGADNYAAAVASAAGETAHLADVLFAKGSG